MNAVGDLVALEAQLWLWMIAMLRPGAAFLAAPVFGAPTVPVQLRLVVSLAIGIPALDMVPFAIPVDGLVSVQGFALIAGEILVGLALGFSVQIGFAAASIAGEVIGNTMGLGFAGMVDPMSGTSTPALGQFLTILATFLFLALGGHLILASIVIDSYRTLPPGEAWITSDASYRIVMFGSDLFAAGLAIALPVGFSLSAPAMTRFGVAPPGTIMAGLVLLAIAAPAMGEGITAAMLRALELARDIARG